MEGVTAHHLYVFSSMNRLWQEKEVIDFPYHSYLQLHQDFINSSSCGHAITAFTLVSEYSSSFSWRQPYQAKVKMTLGLLL